MPRSLVLVAVTALLAAAAAAADPPKIDAKPKRNATVERVKLVGIGGLLEQEAVRRDLGLSQGQQEKIDAEKAELVKKLKATGDAAKAAMQQAEFDVADFQRHTDQFGDQVSEYEAAAAKQLTADQMYRLKQIRLQSEGPTALLGRYAVRELALSPEQEDKIADALRKLTKAQAVNWTTSAAVAPEEPRIAKFLSVRSTELDTLRDNALKHLTAEQKAMWKEMTGESLPTICLLVASPEGFVLRMAYMNATR
jgi:hypothetical protein